MTKACLFLSLGLLVYASCDLLDKRPDAFPCTEDTQCVSTMCLASEALCVSPCTQDSDCRSKRCLPASDGEPAHCELTESQEEQAEAAAEGNVAGATGCDQYCEHIDRCVSPICPGPVEQLTGPCLNDCQAKPWSWNQIPAILDQSCTQIQKGWCEGEPAVQSSCACGDWATPE